MENKKYLKPKLFKFDTNLEVNKDEKLKNKSVNKSNKLEDKNLKDNINNKNEENDEEWRPDLDNALLIRGPNFKPKYKKSDYETNKISEENPFKKTEKIKITKKEKNFLNLNKNTKNEEIVEPSNNLIEIKNIKNNDQVNFKNFKLDLDNEEKKNEENKVDINKKFNCLFETKNKKLKDKFNKIKYQDEKELTLNKVNLFKGKVIKIKNESKKFIKEKEFNKKLIELINYDKVNELKKELNTKIVDKYIKNKNKIKILSNNNKKNFEIILENKDMKDNSLLESVFEDKDEDKNKTINNIKIPMKNWNLDKYKDNNLYYYKDKLIKDRKTKLNNIEKIDKLIKVNNNLKKDLDEFYKINNIETKKKKKNNYKNLDPKSKLKVNLWKIDNIKDDINF